MEVNKEVMTKEAALEELSHDVITSNPYDLLKAVGVNTSSKEPHAVYVGEGDSCSRKSMYEDIMREFSSWLTKYVEISRPERLCVSDIAIIHATARSIHGTMLIVNGMNGMTQVSRQSLKHIMDIMGNLEDHYGSRVYLSQVSSHSDVYYYVLSFVIWSEDIDNAKENHVWGNLKPLYHV
jgi:hypothetical protein